jgi:hypothetical protein
MGAQDRKVNLVIARLAGRAHGVVNVAELRNAGVTRGEVARRAESGALIREFPGVYRVGHRAWSPEARYMAAVKACGAASVLSGRPAGWAWGLIRGTAPEPEVTSPTERRVKGVRTRRSRRRTGTTTWKRIPITSVPRTLIDLASVLSFDDLAYAVHQADVLHGVRVEPIERALRAYPNAPGAATLRAIATGDAEIVLSRLEKLFLALLRQYGLPLPETNRRRGAHYVDCRWPRRRLAVELDSYRYHRSRRSWEQDRQRERDARARGDRFRRYTWKDVVEDPAPTVEELRALLAD